MKGKIFRIAHLGFFDYMDTIALLGALELIARDTLKLPVKFGEGVAAAQEVFANRKPRQALEELKGAAVLTA
jgi:aspartate aminotransferase-like enzyme